ncbi:PLP-dependent aminotransferase family protein [Cohnella faecalis]|uniref:PLP-dependent aminotransferase family protein n=1 Tax=Cohnella faecalis TaxID=2315694 RepID=A0A398CS64_9BACL|nr:PLP-dependent aminotransferase family protein [Cohnella faecalis]RIE01784.1 PLP-dependent aminotransferase family protein [Cohnella faecalis]
MLNLNLTAHSSQPQYMQLYTQIRDQIRSGGVPYGSRLPSVRSLRLQMNISKSTIETAYQILLTEGYAVSKPRSGLYVANPLGVKPYRPSKDSGSAPGEHPHSPPSPTSEPFSIDFRPSAIDEHSFPVRIWRKMLHDALDRSPDKICKYGDPQGEHSFRSVLAEYLRNSRGVVCTPEQIVIGTGIRYCIGVLSKLLTGIGPVAFEEPGYAPVREHLISNGFQIAPIPVVDQGISVEELDNSPAQAVYVTPSHQFPTGRVIPYPERELLLQWARKRNAYIIEDDYDGEFRYFVKPIPSLQGLDRDGRVIYVGTFSKAFTPALRMNYMVLPLELVDKMKNVQYLLDGPSRIDQWAMESFMEQGHWYRHIRRMRKIYGKRHHRFIETIRAHFGDRVQITGHNAGLHIQLTVKTRQPSEALVRLAAEEGVRVYDLPEMWMKPHRSEHPQIYLGFGGMDENGIDKGARLLRKAWEGIWD